MLLLQEHEVLFKYLVQPIISWVLDSKMFSEYPRTSARDRLNYEDLAALSRLTPVATGVLDMVYDWLLGMVEVMGEDLESCKVIAYKANPPHSRLDGLVLLIDTQPQKQAHYQAMGRYGEVHC